MAMNDIQQTITASEAYRHTNTASFALLVYDQLLTLGPEIELVWTAPRTWGKILYFVAAYFVWIDTVPLLFVLSIGGIPIEPSACIKLYKLSMWLILWGFILTEAILAYRTWAIWGGSRAMAFSLILLCFLFSASGNVFLGIGLSHIEYVTCPTPRQQCCVRATAAARILFGDFILLAAFESINGSMTWYKGRNQLPATQSNLVVTLFRDNMRYYLYILGFSLLNIVAISLPHNPGLGFTQLQRVMHTVFTKRIILDLRDSASRDRLKWALGSKFIPTAIEFDWKYTQPSNEESKGISTVTVSHVGDTEAF